MIETILSPACILSFVLTASIRGELGAAWNWSDDLPPSKESEGQQNGAGKQPVKHKASTRIPSHGDRVNGSAKGSQVSSDKQDTNKKAD